MVDTFVVVGGLVCILTLQAMLSGNYFPGKATLVRKVVGERPDKYQLLVNPSKFVKAPLSLAPISLSPFSKRLFLILHVLFYFIFDK